ncbi:AMP-binding protein [Actinokineospora auranticolor]|uniref:Long-chain acyl-CoA synthetase n=1 Tax=Actinokineospora auranticolor TaxID=155976 RepID=A0A2S6GJS3_9PSEU|nr:AMP-binding protein [Actinokineospora auranticolor]PPK65482.1 long-chain acyl-CoA synthetase [Actinokineospora auranticolor]
MTIAARFAAHAGDRPAVVSGDGATVDYAALLARARAFAHALGPEHAAGVALLADRRVEVLEVFLGAALAGVPVQVYDPAWSRAEVAAVLAETRPSLVFTGTDHDVPGVPLGGLRDWVASRPRAPHLPEVPDTAPFYVGFTSGSTGRPKAAVRAHRSWTRTFDRYDEEFGIGPDDHVLVPGSLGHSHFLFGAVHALAAGATLHLLPRFDPDLVLTRVREHPVTVLYLVPTMFEALVDHGRGHFPLVRTVLSAGAKWSPARRARSVELFPGADTAEVYGATELSLVSVLHGGTGPEDSVGRPVSGVELSVRGPGGTEVPPGEPGRVHVRSDMLFTRYLSPDDGSGPDADGFFTTGDIGRLDAGGHLHLLGRTRGMLVSGGVNVYPEEVEAALLRLGEVAEAAVVGLPDGYWGEVVCAAVRWRGAARLDLAALRDRAAEHLSRQKCPQRLFEFAALPHRPTGKVDRARVREMVLDRAGDTVR